MIEDRGGEVEDRGAEIEDRDAVIEDRCAEIENPVVEIEDGGAEIILSITAFHIQLWVKPKITARAHNTLAVGESLSQKISRVQFA